MTEMRRAICVRVVSKGLGEERGGWGFGYFFSVGPFDSLGGGGGSFGGHFDGCGEVFWIDGVGGDLKMM